MKKAKDFIYYPLLVSSKAGEPLSPEEDRKVWETFDKLPEMNRSVLIAHDMPDRIKEFQTTLGLTDSQAAQVSLLVREYYFGVTSLEGVRTGLLNVASGRGDAWKLFQEKILTVRPTLSEEPQQPIPQSNARPVTAVQLPLLQALSKYPELGSQQVTSGKIKIRSEREPVRPTLFNWLKYYRDELGIGYHDSVQRGQFLYRSENGRALSPEERERINLILKSVEDELPLAIDPERKTLSFPAFERSLAPAPVPQTPVPLRAMEERYQKRAPAPAPAAPAPAAKLSFSPAPKPLAAPKPVLPPAPKPRVLPSAPVPAPALAGSAGRVGIVREPAFEPAPLRRTFFRKAATTAPLGNLTFTTRHVMPAEEIGKSIPAPAASAPPQRKAEALPPKRSPFSIRPVSRN